MNKQELLHYGVRGMRWGIRKDGSKGKSSSPESSDSKTAKKLKGKKVSEMSNEELRKLNARLQLEKQLKDLSKKELSPGRKFVTDVLRDSGKELAKNYVKKLAEGAIQNVASAVNTDS